MSAATPMTIARSWAMFRALSIPANAPEDQVKEMRTAFYLGATAVIAMTVEISSDQVTDEQGMEFLDALHREAHEFSAQLVTEAALRRTAHHWRN